MIFAGIDYPIALYGLGTETERFLNECGNELSIVGLLDGFRTDGEMYGYPIIPIEEIIDKEVGLIIVIARPGSCKAISKRIGFFCRENDIALFDVRGLDLLAEVSVSFDLSEIKGSTKKELLKKINDADVVSFDLFDTLVMRKVQSYTDVFELMYYRMKEEGIDINDFAKIRLHAEKELTKKKSPRLNEIYDCIIKELSEISVSSDYLAKMEYEIDSSLMIAREAVRGLLGSLVEAGKIVIIASDSYYSKEQISNVLSANQIVGYEELLVSCEYNTTKTQYLFDIMKERYSNKKILHIGDDEYADIDMAKKNGIEAYRLYSASDLYEALGGLGVEEYVDCVTDHVKTGLFLSHIFNNPFLDDYGNRLSVGDAYDIGYLFCAPMVMDFSLWIKKRICDKGIEQILFVARDGYLPEKIYKMLDADTDTFYFMSSRTAAIRAGMESQEDIDYVDSMKYFGTEEENLHVRFGIQADNINALDRSAEILSKAKEQRVNYRKYINKLGIKNTDTAMFDFVAKGTTQMYLQKIFSKKLKGLYFLQLEPEFMAKKDLDIQPFYTDEEKNTSAIYDNYYILEAILTAPYPQMLEMDGDANPVYAEESRSEQDLQVFERAQGGILKYVEEYLNIIPEKAREENKKFDEKLLELINKVEILDESFLSLKVEDPFFGRMTDMRDILT